MASLLGITGGIRGLLTTTQPLLRRFCSTSTLTLQKLPKQEVTISPKLREALLAQMREAAKYEISSHPGCNSLPLNGTSAHERMMKNVAADVKKYKEASGQ